MSSFTSTNSYLAASAIEKELFDEQVWTNYQIFNTLQIEDGHPIVSLEAFATSFSRYLQRESIENGFIGDQPPRHREYITAEVSQSEDAGEENQENGPDEQRAIRIEEDEEELDYEALLSLSDRLGDVKTERWSLVAPHAIEQLPTFVYTEEQKLTAIYRAHGATYHADCGGHIDDTEQTCPICQSEYEVGDRIRRLPCNHCFHADCVDRWLKQNDQCPTCRHSIKHASAW